MAKNNLLATFLLVFGFVFICIGIYFIYIFAPIEKTLGIPQKIFYFHVSFAWWSFFSFFLVCIYGMMYLIKKNVKHVLFAWACAEIGVVYSTLVLITGIIWAKASWNTFWTWDPRLITTLIMWFMYVVYLVIINMDISENKKFSLCSVLGMLAFIDVPIVFLSARMWRSIHPAVFSSKGGGMPPEMLYTMFINLIAYGILYMCLIILRTGQIKLKYKINNIFQRIYY